MKYVNRSKFARAFALLLLFAVAAGCSEADDHQAAEAQPSATTPQPQQSQPESGAVDEAQAAAKVTSSKSGGLGVPTAPPGAPPNPDVAYYDVTEQISIGVLNGTVTAIAYGGTPQAERATWKGLIGSKYVVGDIHATDVTPQLWRNLDVELQKSDGSIASIQMMRPLWWLEQTGAKEGGTINLTVTEADLYGEARIHSIEANVKADSRRSPPGSALVIGKIRHENAKVISLVLNGDESNALGVTPNHPLYSKDRDQWVEAGNFKISEAIETSDGSMAEVTAKRERLSPEPVYNLEVHRAMSYYVGSQGLLAHNTGIDCARAVIDSLQDNLFTELNCKACAQAMADALKSKGISGEILTFEVKGNRPFMVNDLLGGGTSITQNGTHEAVRVGDVIFDNYFRKGIDADTYLDSLHGFGGLERKSRSF